MGSELTAILELLRERLPAAADRPLLLDTAGAVAHVGVSRSAFFRLVASGAITGVYVPGSDVRYRRQDLDRYVERLKPGRRKQKATHQEVVGEQAAA